MDQVHDLDALAAEFPAAFVSGRGREGSESVLPYPSRCIRDELAQPGDLYGHRLDLLHLGFVDRTPGGVPHDLLDVSLHDHRPENQPGSPDSPIEIGSESFRMHLM